MNNTVTKDIGKNSGLLENILSEMGEDFCLNIKIESNHPDESFSLRRVYEIRKRGLFGSSNLILGAKNIFRLYDRWYGGEDTVRMHEKPPVLERCKIIRDDYISANVKKLIADSDLPEIKQCSYNFNL